jgi:hypothetical protein
MNPITIDLFAFPKHVNSSYMPSELDAIKDSINSNHQFENEPESETTYTPSKNLLKFPPNSTDNSYLPPEKVESKAYLPPSSGDGSEEDTEPYVPPKKLHNFPPNVNSNYLPPRPFSKSKAPINSYLPSPSGDENDGSENSDSSNEETTPYTPPKDLFNFPPNHNSKYLPPKPFTKNRPQISSYLPPASGGETKKSPDDAKPYVPPKDLHNFPPNVDSKYLPPQIKAKSKNPISSYLPPPSGDDTEVSPEAEDDAMPYAPPKDLHNFPPNIESNYLPPQMNVPEIPNNSYLAPASGSESDLPYMYLPPKNLHNFPPNVQSSYLPPEMKQVMESVNSYLPPPSGSVSGFSVGSKQNIPGPAPPSYSYPPPPPPMTAPSGPPMMPMPIDMMPMDMMPPSAPEHDHHHHDHHHHHDEPPPEWQPPHEIYYDYDPHQHHHHPEPLPETTTVEAPEEPRVKKYSYYYLGRKLWYIPLYFTLWFCLYVAALIIRSIGRHKVN